MQAQTHQRHASVAQEPRPLMRARSETITSLKSMQRPGSQGSTTSEHSVGTNTFPPYQARPHSSHQPGYTQQLEHVQPPYYHGGPEEALFQLGQDEASGSHYGMHPDIAAARQFEIDLHNQATQNFSDAEMHHYHMQGYPQGMPQYAIPQQQSHHQHSQSRQFDSIENQSPAPDDSENTEAGPKKKKGAATSLANDAELRRLLSQYSGRCLKDVAAEVQRKEGGEGKSEKAKQVFAMLWLQENCKRSSNSVRRDKVFSRYTERCGNERVPTLNPASFGKLVRIIFPNVQTRRLGVRGESKYHYVDLSLAHDEDERQQQAPYHMMMMDQSVGGEDHQQQQPSSLGNFQNHHTRSASVPQTLLQQPSTDTADFPPPSKHFAPRRLEPAPATQPAAQNKEASREQRTKMHDVNTAVIRLRTPNMSTSLISALPAVRTNAPATVSVYLGLPSPSSYTDSVNPDSPTSSPIDLPDIHSYLVGETYDRDIAESLSHLYRSYCIVAIESFRYCKEKPFFHHHSAFNGTMTVPVSKMLSNEKLAPWIQECDMRMYKKMIGYIAALVTQVVPGQVWSVLDNVSKKLVPHLAAAFEEKVAKHALVAKIVPAARFCHLLRSLKAANTAANRVDALLNEPQGQTQMWMDLLGSVDPDEVMEQSTSPLPECLGAVESMLRYDLKSLVNPTNDEATKPLEQDMTKPFAAFLAAPALEGSEIDSNGLLGSSSMSADTAADPLYNWIRWLERLPVAFPVHYPQSILRWLSSFMKSILNQLGANGAASYSAWFYLEAFLTKMLTWLMEMEGLLMEESEQKEHEGLEIKQKKHHDSWFNLNLVPGGSALTQEIKRKRDEDDIGAEDRSRSRASIDSQTTNEFEAADHSRPQTAGTTATTAVGGDEHDDLDSGPLELPSIEAQSPQKRFLHEQAHDDSGIGLMDREDTIPASSPFKKLRKDLGLLSDPVDADGHVVVA